MLTVHNEWPAVRSGGQAQVLAVAADWHVRCDADRYGLVTFLEHQKVASYLSCLSWMTSRLFLRALPPLFEICALLGYYAPYSGNSFLTFRNNLSVPSSRTINPRRNLLLLLHLSLFFLFPLRPSFKEKVQRIKQVVDEKRGLRPVSYFLVVLRVVIGYRIVTTGSLWRSDMRLESEPDANIISICCRQWNSRDVSPQRNHRSW
jgi:hypothetical protein